MHKIKIDCPLPYVIRGSSGGNYKGKDVLYCSVSQIHINPEK